MPTNKNMTGQLTSRQHFHTNCKNAITLQYGRPAAHVVNTHEKEHGRSSCSDVSASQHLRPEHGTSSPTGSKLQQTHQQHALHKHGFMARCNAPHHKSAGTASTGHAYTRAA
jgi:hypothetical protein